MKLLLLLSYICLAFGWQVSFNSTIADSFISGNTWFALISTDTLAAVDTNDGQVLWTWNVTATNSCPQEKWYSFPCGLQSLTYDSVSGNLVVAIMPRNVNVSPYPAAIFAFDGETGEIMWKVTVPCPFRVTALAAGPGIIYGLQDTYLILTAYNASSGDIIWQTKQNQSLYNLCFQQLGTRYKLGVSDTTIVLGCGNNLAGWNLKGESLWLFNSQNGPDQFGMFIITPSDSLVYSTPFDACSYQLPDFEKEWCLEGVDNPLFSSVDPIDGTLQYQNWTTISLNLTSTVSIVCYSKDGEYMWTSEFYAVYPGGAYIWGQVFGEDGLWYWPPGVGAGDESGTIFSYEPDTGALVNIWKGFDPYLQVIQVDKTKMMYGQGWTYLMTKQLE